MAIPPSHASDRIRPLSVTNKGDAPVTVIHRGMEVRLNPEESTHAFDEIPFSGDWGVVLDTGAYNHSCPSDSAEAEPPVVNVVIVTACG